MRICEEAEGGERCIPESRKRMGAWGLGPPAPWFPWHLVDSVNQFPEAGTHWPPYTRGEEGTRGSVACLLQEGLGWALLIRGSSLEVVQKGLGRGTRILETAF